MTELRTDNDVVEAFNLDPVTGSPGSHPVGTGIGATGGVAAGMAIGSMVAGPLGTAVAGAVGAVAGGLAGKGVGEAINPTAEIVTARMASEAGTDRPIDEDRPVDPVAEDLYWQRAFITEPYYDSELSYDDYAPAYRVGIAHRLGDQSERSWDEVEAEVQALWRHRKGISRLYWEQAKEPIRAAWHRVDHALKPQDPYFGVT
ncbi:MAG TPA: hypothetical protein VGH80_11040 [Xanthomonadaceae bacterium]